MGSWTGRGRTTEAPTGGACHSVLVGGGKVLGEGRKYSEDGEETANSASPKGGWQGNSVAGNLPDTHKDLGMGPAS